MRPYSTTDRVWSIILAGGEGTRLRSLVHRWLGSAQTEAVLRIRRHALHVPMTAAKGGLPMTV